jgi:septum formation inhibitor-activating ATPase MinD
MLARKIIDTAEELSDENAEILAQKLSKHPLYTVWQKQAFSFTGGKGGIGKTSVLLAAAQWLAKNDRKVIIIDCDSLAKTYYQAAYKITYTGGKNELPVDGGRTISVYTLCNIKTSYDLPQYAAKDKPFAASLYTYQELNDLTRQTASNNTALSNNVLLKLLDNLWLRLKTEIDTQTILLYDCGAGLSFSAMLPNYLSAVHFIITNPEPTALADGAGMLKQILYDQYITNNVWLVINKMKPSADVKKLLSEKLKTLEDFVQKWSNQQSKLAIADYIAELGFLHPAINAARLSRKIIELVSQAGG